MSHDLSELYQQVILDHHRKPRNYGKLAAADHAAEGYNPLCGDRIRVELRLSSDGRLADVGFTGAGCAICTASASLMTEHLRDKTPEQILRTFEGFTGLVTGQRDVADEEDVVGKLVVFAGVREFPVRVKCATLPWHTLRAALERRPEPVTTE
ncbi:MAG: Fe-S cluster assembly sulfur transfer protein SufU [Candidatus Eiseniibacteriota bacterium]